MSSAIGKSVATLDDLARVEGKAELIGGRVVHLMPTGFWPGAVGGEIYSSLKIHARAIDRGRASPDGVGYTVPELPSGRESFCPDASYFDGPLPAKWMRFVEGPPTFAVEVRSENDYGPAAEREMAAKRLDYFAAGTRVVWDVDPEAEIVLSYKADSPDQPVTFLKGQIADAEPAVPGWRLAVDEIFT